VTLTDGQLERYARHIVLKEIGGAGQQRLLSARVAVVGAGGIGCPAIAYLAAAGVGNIRVIDPDTVALSNLQRQILYGTADLGHPKAEAAHAAVSRLNPDVHLVAINQRIDADNAAILLRDVDVILDGCDNFETRLAVSDAATAARIPLVSAAVGGFDGQVGVWRGWEQAQPCYRCLVGADPARADASCADQGIVGAVTGIVGSLAALEVIRLLVPFGEDMAGKMLITDLMTRNFRSVRVTTDPACPACAAINVPA
jgi:molybdopterin/thiamine biosynthesis adenylyltransferase